MNFDDRLDALGALCPIPVLKAQKRLKNLNSGEVLNVLADDPAATIDFPHFCNVFIREYFCCLDGYNHRRR